MAIIFFTGNKKPLNFEILARNEEVQMVFISIDFLQLSMTSFAAQSFETPLKIKDCISTNVKEWEKLTLLLGNSAQTTKSWIHDSN